MSLLRAAEIHARLGTSWPTVLARLGIGEEYLRLKKAGPCPACGGRDRFVFDNRRGRGDFFCRGCGAGDGFELLARVFGWGFAEARREVLSAAGIVHVPPSCAAQVTVVVEAPQRAIPPGRVRSIVRSACPIADCPEAVAYLGSRDLWPLPDGCTLRAHPGVDYWDSGQAIARYPVLVGAVRDVAGELVTAHVTYLQAGKKLSTHEPRKLLSPLSGHQGCAVRLMGATEVLGIAEGIETALSAGVLDGVPVWAALNAALLAKFEPPSGIKRLLIFADRDAAGLLAAGQLMQRLQGRVDFELRSPSPPYKDFNDQLKGAKHV
jgi:putative DNA primase/helicase